MSEGEGGKRERSGPKLRNSVQSGPKGSAACNDSACGISNNAENSSTRAGLLGEKALKALVNGSNVCWN
jgi:hypothetical protein